MADSPYAPNAGKQLNKQPPVNPSGKNIGQTYHDPWTLDEAQSVANYTPVFPMSSYFLKKSKDMGMTEEELNTKNRTEWLPVQQQATRANRTAVTNPNDDQQIQELFAQFVLDKSLSKVIEIDAQQAENRGVLERAMKAELRQFSWQMEEDVMIEIQSKATMTMTSTQQMTMNDLNTIQDRFEQAGLYGKELVAFYSRKDYSQLVKDFGAQTYDSSRTTGAIEQYKVPNFLANIESYQQAGGVELTRYDIDTVFVPEANIAQLIRMSPDTNVSSSNSDYENWTDGDSWSQFPSTYNSPGDVGSGMRDNRFARVACVYFGTLYKWGANQLATTDRLQIPAGSRFTVGNDAKAIDGFTKAKSDHTMQFTLVKPFQPTDSGSFNADKTIQTIGATQWMTVSPCPISGKTVPADMGYVGAGLPSAYQTYAGAIDDNVATIGQEHVSGIVFLNEKTAIPSYVLTPESVKIVAAPQHIDSGAGVEVSEGLMPNGVPVTFTKQYDMDGVKYRIKLMTNYGVSMIDPNEGLVFLPNQPSASE